MTNKLTFYLSIILLVGLLFTVLPFMLGIILFVVIFAVVLGVILSSLKSALELKEDKNRVVSQETLVTVGQYIHLIDAQFAQMRLESEGIEVYLGDEHIILIDPLYSPAVGGVRIQVGLSDAVRGRKLLEAKPDATDMEEPAEKYQGTGEPCPQCGSYNIYLYRDFFVILGILTILVCYSLLPIAGRKRMYCFDCKHKWKSPLKKTPDKDSKEEWQKRMDKTLKTENKRWK